MRWAWEEARAAFQDSVNDCETPEALEGLGTAASWLDDAPAALSALERAYRLYRDAGDDEAGARVAVTIADGLLTFRGEPAVAAGWLARARSCLRGNDGAPMIAFIDALAAFLAMAHERDVARALSLGRAAVQRSRHLGETDLEMVSQAILGVILVSSGKLNEGMRMLDEATTAVVAGDVKDPYAAANVCCALVTASVRVRDFSRLAQWARNAMDISREWPDRALFSVPTRSAPSRARRAGS